LVYPRRFGIDSHIDTKLITDIQSYLDHAMNRASHSMFRRSRDSGLSFSQMVILRKLNWHGDASASELSEFLEISKAALSQAVDKLADLGPGRTAGKRKRPAGENTPHNGKGKATCR
jgi:hypothetical protein